MRSPSNRLDIIYLQPHTFIWHGTPHGTPDEPSLKAATVDQVLGRNNFFGHHDYAAEYATYGGRRTGLPGGRPSSSDGRPPRSLYAFRWKDPTEAVPLIALDECHNVHTLSDFLNGLSDNHPAWLRWKKAGQPRKKFATWWTNLFSDCVGPDKRRVRLRTGDGDDDRLLFEMLISILPEGIAGFIQREMDEDGAELHLGRPGDWLKHDDTEQIETPCYPRR
jgi:hypothetical protein